MVRLNLVEVTVGKLAQSRQSPPEAFALVILLSQPLEEAIFAEILDVLLREPMLVTNIVARSNYKE